MLHVEVIATPELGDRTYIAHDGDAAVVVDPQRDLDRVESVLRRLDLRPSLVLETHVHNDYVSGGLELARRSGARYGVCARDDVGFDRHPVEDGDELAVGTLRVRAVATPGHTRTHLSYVVADDDPVTPAAAFTGGSLLFGSVGRTDLVDPAITEELTRAQYRSARALAGSLPAGTAVYPTHGFGSFCSAGPTAAGDSSTIGAEWDRNEALTQDEDPFVRRLLDGLTAYPAYYRHMAPLNRQGPAAVDLSPLISVDPHELAERIAAGEWVVDVRDRTAYAAEHVVGTVSLALGPQFATFLGWLLPWGSPLTLIGTCEQQIADAQRQLVRIGIDRPAGAAVGSPGQLANGGQTGSYRRASFAELADRRRDELDGGRTVVVDVRRADEQAEAAIPGSVLVPLQNLPDRLGSIPDGQVWVHCAVGYRAGIAASLLARGGRDVVLIDDDVEHAVAVGLTG